MILESYEQLLEKIEDELEREFAVESMKRFPEYVNCVFNEVITMPHLKLRYEGEDFRSRVASLDEKRRMTHDSAISAARILNRMCKNHGIEPFCPETEDRYVIGDFCALITVDIFKQGTRNTSLDDLIDELCKLRGGER